MSLKNILDQIESNRPNAEMDVQMGSPETYGGRLGLKRAAVEALKRLKLEYRNKLMESTAFVVVTGTGRAAFTELATNEIYGCFSSDPDNFYKDICSRIDPSVFGREGVRNIFGIAANVLEDKALELDISSYPMLAFDERYNTGVKSAEEFLPVLRNAINDQVGPEIVGIDAVNAIVDKAIANKHSKSVTPIILSTANEKFAFDLQKDLKRLTSKVFLVVSGKTSNNLNLVEGAISVKKVSEETVQEAMATIKNKI